MIDFDGINQAALGGDYVGLLRGVLGSDARVVNGELVARNPRRNDRKAGSFLINIRTGVWSDFAEDGVGGSDPVSLWQYLFGHDSMGSAARALASMLGCSELAGDEFKPQKPSANQEWTPIVPVPDYAPEPPDIKWAMDEQTGKWVSHPIVARWAYRDESGGLVGYAARVKLPDGEKDVVPQTFCRGEDGEEKWRVRGMPKPRSIYNLPAIACSDMSVPVVIFEGEKTADAGTQLLQSYVCTTWAGGAKAIDQTDFDALRGRDVIVWPDNDGAGFNAAIMLSKRLNGVANSIKYVIPPDFAPEKWDIADDFPDGWSAEQHICRHAVDLASFRRAVFGEEEQKTEVAAPKKSKIDAEIERYGIDLGAIDWYSPFPDMDDGGKKPLSTIENVIEACARIGCVARYNVIAKKTEVLIKGERYSMDNADNSALARLESCLRKFRIPKGDTDNYINFIADQNLFNPVAEWVRSKPWDGETRIPQFISTIIANGEADDEIIGRAKEFLMCKWMLSAVAAAFEPAGVSAHGILVLQGDQSLGKTSWFKSLVPRELGVIQDGMTLRPDDKDSVKQVVSHWLVELGELDATFKKSDISQIKSFVTRDKDILRLPYARRESEFARRTVFFGSVNPKNFLRDDTGNRRYWTISCDRVYWQHGIDMQQLWAEFYELYKQGQQWHLTFEENDILNQLNDEHSEICPIEEKILGAYNWQCTNPALWRWMTITDVLEECGIGGFSISRADTVRAGVVITKHGTGKTRKSNGRKLALIPPKIDSFSAR